jgi:DNA-binding IclR family transcriptional regulator
MAVVKAVDNQKYELKLVVETFLILEKILEAQDGLALTEVCKCTHISKNKAFRMLATLIQCGILEKDERGNYKLGNTSIENAHRILAKSSSLDRARLMMESLAKIINEAVYFAKYSGPEAVLVDFIDCCQSIKAASFIGAAIQLPPVTCRTTVAKIGDITVDTEGLSSEITTVSMPYTSEQGVEMGALVVLAPTYRMTPHRITTEIVPALRDVMQRPQLQLHDSLQGRVVPVFPPVWFQEGRLKQLKRQG